MFFCILKFVSCFFSYLTLDSGHYILMSMTIYEQITKFLKSNLVPFEELNHEAVYTSEEAARVRGLEQSSGAKSLLLKADQDFVLAVLPGDQKLDTKKFKNILGIKNLRFATPDEVKEIMHCEIGACYPFGNLIDIKMVVDKTLENSEFIAFNPGLHNKSIKLRWKDYQEAVNPEIVQITK
jgi:Ala-tRNA(Pro) deacylase